MLTKEQEKVFRDLLQSPDFKGKKALNHLLWRNTTQPKYKVGDCVHVTEDTGHRVFGHEVRNFKGRITEIRGYMAENVYHYSLEGVVVCGDKETTVNYYTSESLIGEPCEDNVTVIEVPKSDCADEILLSLKDLI